MPLVDQYAAEGAGDLRNVSPADLPQAARDYIWLAEFGPVEGRGTFFTKRDGVIAELRAGVQSLPGLGRSLHNAVSGILFHLH